MKYLKRYEGSSKVGTYFIVNMNDIDDSFKKIEEIFGEYPIFNFDFKTNWFKDYNQEIAYIGKSSNDKYWVYNPAIHDDLEGDLRYGYFSFRRYEFGGYINTTRREAKSYIQMLDRMYKYNI